MLKLSITLSAIISSALLIVAPAFANNFERDFEQPIQVNADYQEIDSRANRLLYQDNVVIAQGSLLINAERLEVESTADELGDGEIFVATGSPARYQQDVEEGVTVEAQANEIRYDSGTGILTLRGNAELRQLGNLVRASQITYYVNDQRVTAQRSDDGEDRVTTIFQPRTRNQSENENNGNP
ncbi:lipopolysaccharide transport periplasmic protein LptA [Aliidiomarina minuta]|uniref:Lipopolysaccharide export system protein LptA n=1 Tax=Aliidiomarina minuta TaxID=880057 RepID=A0A432W9D4_9GAMM|nr:lipopolysaccharide transport periplasmic protein LptA [Aliidiomarina minuta]RUO26655.1 lipopolysaccharide transport periplasmic protein LptA [Aliidiomarina minuta]